MSNLSDLDTMILRDTSNPPLTDKGSALTYGEFDGNFVEIYNAIQDIVNGANVTAYDAGATYDLYSTNPKEKFVSYNSRIWQAAYVGSPSSFTGQTPAEGSYWTQVSLAQMLGNPVALTKIAEAFDDTLEASIIYKGETLSSSSKTLLTTPIEILAASGDADVAYVLTGLDLQIEAGATPFDFTAGGCFVKYNGSSEKLTTITQAKMNSATDVFYSYTITNFTTEFNTSVKLSADDDASVGNGTYHITPYFRKVTKQF